MNGNPRDDQTRPLAGKTVLLAEDSITRWILADLLASMGVRTRMAVSGREAVDLALQEPFDLILMDVMMPEMDGIEATRRIRRQEAEVGGQQSEVRGQESEVGGQQSSSPDHPSPFTLHHPSPPSPQPFLQHPSIPASRHPKIPAFPHPRVPIIALTSLKRPEDVARCMEAGMDGCLRKPVTLQSLEAVLVQFLPGEGTGDGTGDAVGGGMEGTARDEQAGFSAPTDTGPVTDLTAIPAGSRKQAQTWKALALDYVDAELPRSLERAVELAAAGELEAMSRVLHKIKGIAMFFGMPGLTRFCADLKLAARGGSDGAVQDVSREIPGHLRRLRQAIADVKDGCHGP